MMKTPSRNLNQILVTFCCLMLCPVLLLGQDGFFEIERPQDFRGLGKLDFAVSPDSSTIVLSFLANYGEFHNAVVTKLASFNKNGKVSFKSSLDVVSGDAGLIFNHSITYHSGENQFLVVWDENGQSTLLADIGGRLMDRKGKPLGKPLAVVRKGREQTQPMLLAYSGSPANAPNGAAYFIAWFENREQGAIMGQWFDRALQPLGEVKDLEELDTPMSPSSYMFVGNNIGMVSLIGSDSKQLKSLHLLRFFLNGSKNSSSIELMNGEMETWTSTSIFAVSEKAAILGTVRGYNFFTSTTENYQIKNKSRLKAGRKVIEPLPESHPKFNNIVQLDDSRIFQVVFTLDNEIVVQELDKKGKPKGEPSAVVAAPIETWFTTDAVALPGGDQILIAFGAFDQNSEAVIMGTVISVN